MGNDQGNSLKKRYSTFALGVLCLNILVILWGAVVRATGSGAGCGSHWPLCNGEVMPLQPKIETLVEFTHRLSSGLAFLGVVGLVILAQKTFSSTSPVWRFALLSLVFIIVESLIGAGLVLFELVGKNTSITRPMVVSVHLINTLVLLGFLSLTWWRSKFPQEEKKDFGHLFPSKKELSLFGIFIFLIGVSGAIAALGNTLFPSSNLVEGIQKDFDPRSHSLIRIRMFHPFFAIFGAFLVFAIIYRAMESDSRPIVRKLGWTVIALGVLQLMAGLITLFLLAPVWMQIIHLLLADLLWIAFVVFIDTKRHTYWLG